jgi:hypothetical protein
LRAKIPSNAPVALAVTAALTAAFVAFALRSMGFLGAGIVTATGILLLLVQWLFVRRIISPLPFLWAIPAAACALPALLAHVGSLYDRSGYHSWLIESPWVIGLAAGVVAGFLQWLIIRSGSALQPRTLPLLILAWGVALALYALVIGFLVGWAIVANEPIIDMFVLPAIPIAGVCSGLLIGVATRAILQSHQAESDTQWGRSALGSTQDR